MTETGRDRLQQYSDRASTVSTGCHAAQGCATMMSSHLLLSHSRRVQVDLWKMIEGLFWCAGRSCSLAWTEIDAGMRSRLLLCLCRATLIALRLPFVPHSARCTQAPTEGRITVSLPLRSVACLCPHLLVLFGFCKGEAVIRRNSLSELVADKGLGAVRPYAFAAAALAVPLQGPNVPPDAENQRTEWSRSLMLTT